METKVALCIPTLNPGVLAQQMVNALKAQTQVLEGILIVDSSSDDGCVSAYRDITDKIITIERRQFDHGGTRNIAFEKLSADIVIFMTQDAIPVEERALERLVQGLLDNPHCGLVYGRQVPSEDAGVFARHARLYNYPSGEEVILKKREDIPRLGIKAAFCSDSFAAYRRDAMAQIDFFSKNTLFAEDSLAAARLLQQGWQIAYVPQAKVTHSHDYSLWQDFRRYFDVGAFHSMNQWYMDFLGKAEGEGKKFVRSEYQYLKQAGETFSLPKVVLRNGIRWLGYQVGRNYRYCPLRVKLKVSTNKAFWLRMKNSPTEHSEV